MSALEKLLVWLDGKKTILFGVANAVNVYLMSAGVISNELGTMITTIIMLLSGGSVYASNKVLGKASRQK